MHTKGMFYLSIYSASLFCFTFQKAALDCTTVGWGSCTLIGVGVDDKGLTVSPLDILMGRTINGSAFGGQLFFPFNFLHTGTQIVIAKVIE